MSKLKRMPALLQWLLCRLQQRAFVVSTTHAVFAVFVLFALPLFFLTRAYTPSTHVYAAASDTLNFQARLQTASGAIVPDGYYNIQFKLYSASTGGTALWTETYAYNSGSGSCTGPVGGNDCRVRVVNGYVSVYLGSITSFPTTIPWDQQLYVTMNIDQSGTTNSGTITYDGEMTPRLKLTAVPYAMQAKSAGQLQSSSGSNQATLNFSGTSTGNVTYNLNAATTPGTYDILTAPTGSDGYVKLQSSTPTQQVGNFNISGAGLVGGLLQGGTLKAGSTQQFQVDASGNVTTSGSLSTGSGSLLTVGGATLNTTLSIADKPTGGNIGTAAATVDIYTNFIITQTTAGQTLTIPAPTSTLNGRLIYITNVGSAGYTLGGSIASPGTTMAFVWNSTTNTWTLVSSGTSGNYIQNGTAVQTANFNIQSMSTSSVTATIQGANSQTANILEVKAAGVGTPLFSVGPTSISAGTDMVLAAGKSITITGGTTASRPASPTEGMLYYDTSTHQLLVYNGGKWKASGSEAILVAASDSSAADKAAADYLADGNTATANDGDQVEINQALTAGAGKKVLLLAGTYTIDNSISVPNNTTLAGVGAGTFITIPNALNGTNFYAITNTTTGGNGTGITIQDLTLDGNKANQTSGLMDGIYFSGMGSSTLAGGKVTNVWANNWYGHGIALYSSSANNTITGNTVQGNGSFGIVLSVSTNNVVSNNIVLNNSTGIQIGSAGHNTISNNTVYGNANGINISTGTANTVSGNIVRSNTSYGIVLAVSSINNVVSGNKLTDNGGNATNNAIYFDASANSNNTITSNNITDATATTNYAINIQAGSTNAYLADNTLGGGTVNDLGTGTIYGGQSNGVAYVIQPTTNITIGSASTTTTIQGSLSITPQTSTSTTLLCSNAGVVSTCDSSLLSPTATNFIQNQSSTTQSGNFNIQSTSGTAVAATIKSATGGTADILQVYNNAGVKTVYVDNNGTLLTTNGARMGNIVSYGTAVLGISTTSASNVGAVVRGVASQTGDLLQLQDTNSNVLAAFSATGSLSVQNVSVAAGKTIALAGGNTASRPSSPTEGMLYYDTDTKQLLTYANGKWQGDRSTATKIVAASNSSQAEKDAADYVATGTGDQTVINNALTAAAGGKVYLMEGTYTINGSISVPNNTTLAGAGAATLITIPNSFNTNINAITNTTTGGNGTGITIQDLKLDGNKANQTAGDMRGIYFNGVGSGSGSSAIAGGKITGVWANNWYSTVAGGSGITLIASSNNVVSGNITQGNNQAGIGIMSSSNNNTITGNTTENSGMGIYLSSSSKNTITGNTSQGNGTSGVELTSSSNNTITGNTMQGNSYGVYLVSNSGSNTVASNNLYDNGGSTTNNAIYFDASSSNTVTGNTIADTSATTTNYAINISNSTSSANYLASNTLGGGTVNDAGTGTIYGGQSNGTTYNIQPATNITIGSASTTTTIQGSTKITPQTSTSTTLLCSNGGILSACDSSVLAPTATNFIQNGLTVQSSSNFYISGTGRTDTAFITPAIRAAADSTTAIAIQNAAGTTNVVTVDTTNNRVGIGTTGAPTTTLHVSVSNSTTTTPEVKIEQTGTGDASVEFKTPGQSYYLGVDSSSTNRFKLSSGTATGASGTVGYETVGANTDSNDAGSINFTKFTAPTTGTIYTIYAYVAAVGTSPNNKAQMAIYSNSGSSPNSLLGNSSETTLTANSWNAFTVSSGISVTAGQVIWLAYNANGPAGTNNNMKYDSNGTSSQVQFKAVTYGSWPSPVSSFDGNSAIQFSVYALITGASADNFGASLMSMGRTGDTIFQNSTNSTAAFSVQNATGSTNVLTVDTTNSRVGIGLASTETPSYTLSFSGASDSTIAPNQRTTTGAGRQLTVQGGTGNAGAGGALVLQGGAGNGTNQAGGAVTIVGGTPTGSSTVGAVTIQATTGSTTIGNTTGTVSVTGSTVTVTGATNINTSGTATTTIGNSGATTTVAGTTGITGATTINGTGSAATNLGTGTGNTTIGNTTGTVGVTGSTVTVAGTTSITGTTTINTTGSAATSIGTGTGAVTIGNTTGTLQLSSNTFNLSTAGAITGATGITMASGNFLQNGSGTFQTGTGAVSLNGDTTIASGKNFMTAKGADYSTTGSQNNVSLSGALIRLTGSSAQTITGITAGTSASDGRRLTLVNTASQAATLSNSSASSSAGNQIITGTGSDLTIPAGASVELIYDWSGTAATSFWRVTSAVATNGGYANTALSNLSSTNINQALNTTAGDLTLQTTTSGNINLSAVGTINLNSNTTVATGKNFTVTNGTTSLTGTTNVNTTGTATTTIGNSGATNAIAGTTGITGATTINGTGAAATNLGTGTGATTIGNTTGTVGVTGSTVTVAGTTSITGATSINTTGAANTNIGNGSTGTVTIGNATTGAIALQSGTSIGLTAPTTITGATTINGTGSAATNLGTGTGSTTIGNTTGTVGVTGSTVTVAGATNVNTTGTATTTIGNANATNTIAGTTGITGATTINGTGTGTTTVGSTIGGAVSISASAAISMQTAASGIITIGSQTATNTVVNVGTVGNAAFSSTVNIGNSTGAAQTVYVGSTNGTSTTTISAGTGGLAFNASTISTSATTLGLFNTTATTVTMLQAGTSISLGATTGTFTVRNANTTLGNAAGSGTFTNNGSTKNATLALGDLAAGYIGSAATTVDVYTSFTISPTASGRTYTIYAPTDGAAGRTIYISNISSSYTFIIGTTTFNAHSTATMVYDGTNWNFAGMDGGSNNYIQNQTATQQAAGFNISGAGTIGGLLTGNGGATIVGTTSINGTGTANTTIGNATGTVGVIGSTISLTGTTGITGATTITGNTSINTTGTGATTIGSTSGGAVNITANAASNITTNTGLLTLQGAGGVSVLTSNTTVSSAITIQTGNASAGASGSISIDTGTATTTTGTISIGTTNASAVNIGKAAGATNIISNTTNLGTNGGTILLQAVAGASGNALNIKGGAATSGNTNGGNLVLSGGAGSGTGVMGLVTLSPTAFTSIGSTQSFSASGSLTAGLVDTYSTIPVTSTGTGVVVTIPAPAALNQVVGRVLYVAAANGSNDFSILLAGTSINIAMKANSTATLIWNGTGWTAAGASSSTDLQSAYNNTLTSAGGAELVLNAPGGSADGLTIRNNGVPITGALFEVQSSIATNLFSVNNNTTEYAVNGGAENSTFTGWTNYNSGVAAKSTTAGTFATGLAGVSVTTSGTSQGTKNTLASTLSAGIYVVSFAAKVASGTNTFNAWFSSNGTTQTATCDSSLSGSGYAITQNFSVTTAWTKVSCFITVPAGATSSNAILIANQSNTVFYIDNLSVISNAAGTTPANVQIGGGATGGQPTLFTLDQFAGPPMSTNNAAYYGSMYYDTTKGAIQCYQSSGWGACGSAPDDIVTLTPEYTGAVLDGTGVGTMTADFCANGAGLTVNTTLCTSSGDARNYYQWTSPQPTAQTYSIYVNYKLPSTFKQFYDDNTITLTGYSTNTSNATVAYSVYRRDNSLGALSQCGTSTTVTTSAGSWQTVSTNGNEYSGCSWSGGDYIIFKIDVTAKSNATAYVENLNFRYTNK